MFESKNDQSGNIAITIIIFTAMILIGLIGWRIASSRQKSSTTSNKNTASVKLIADDNKNDKSVDCVNSAPKSSLCKVVDKTNSFKISFPSKPKLTTDEKTAYEIGKGGFLTDSNTKVKVARFELNYKKDNSQKEIAQTYYVEVLTFEKSLSELGVINNESNQNIRLYSAYKSPMYSCLDFNDTLANLSKRATFNGLPAMQIIKSKKNSDGNECSYKTLTILKDRKTYSISYYSTLKNDDLSAYNNFIKSFSLEK